MNEVTWTARCPAKVNLYLRVLERRPDGYHELDTVFQAIDLWDRLTFEPASELTLACDTAGVPTDHRNLVVQAVQRLADESGVERPGGAFTLHKRIPAQGGLGGGSSDAAAALLICNAAWGLGWSRERLASVGAQVGADVPFFLWGGTARGRGRGDRITAMAPVVPTPLILGFPPFGVPTPEAFAGAVTTLELPQAAVDLTPGFVGQWPAGAAMANWPGNDLERIVFPRWPELARFRASLIEKGASYGLLSGSGSTVFGAFAGQSQEQLEQIAAVLVGDFPEWSVVTTQTVDQGAACEPAGPVADGQPE